jgi:putative endonuclease
MSREVGNIAEDKAAKYLQGLGYEIIDRNFYSRFGEIDIIAKKDKILHFVEVKSGKNFDPVYALTPRKLDKIIKTVNYYILKNKINISFSIDAVIIRGNEIEFLENITIF